jgi:DNA primase
VVARVEAVLEALDIKTERRQRAGWLWGHCPYHNDRNIGSWRIRIDPRHERYGQNHCFVCDDGGSLAYLVSHVRGITVSGAHDWLNEFEDQLQVIEEEVPTLREEIVDKSRRKFEMPHEVIFEALPKWVSPARLYIEKRGVTASQVRMFCIGYTVEGRLAGRIVFTTVDSSMRFASYMARDFSGSRRAKRYLWPAAEEGADSNVMFGEHLWPLPQYREKLYVTEGAFNALAIERVLPSGSVGALGSTSTVAHYAAKIATFKHVVIVTDSDEAGDNAATELQTALARHSVVSRVRLPEGKDANDLSADELREAIWPTPIPV